MATLTINIPAAGATRLQAALQEIHGLEELATMEDLKQYVITDLKQLVRASEARVAVAGVIDEEPPNLT